MSNKEEPEKIRLIFMGTPEFALPGLQCLIDEPGFEIAGIFTQPDKAVGRKQVISASPIKKLAETHNLRILQPEKIKSALETIKALEPDLIVVIAYGQIIPQSILDIPKYGCINVHASLLPRYRGAACLNAPILNGDKETGVTIMKMEAGLDTGPILRQAKLELKGSETLEFVHDNLSKLSAEILVQTLHDWVENKIKARSQNETESSYIKTLNKEDGKINWLKNADEIERMVRAYNPWPGTFSRLEKEDKIIKILEASNQTLKINKYKPGEIFLDNDKLSVQCRQDSLHILRLQMSGKNPLSAKEFLMGNSDIIGKILE